MDDVSKRPLGITNEEYRALIEEIRKIFTEYDKKYWSIPKSLNPANNINISQAHLVEGYFIPRLAQITKRYFLEIPSQEKSFVDEDYIKTAYFAPSNEDLLDQKVGCSICKENRSLDRAHIIPSKFVKNLNPKIRFELITGMCNLVLLCPNHHRFFDRGRLSKTEWKIINIASLHPLAIFFLKRSCCLGKKHFGMKQLFQLRFYIILSLIIHYINGA